jgi:hypothetical protein
MTENTASRITETKRRVSLSGSIVAESEIRTARAGCGMPIVLDTHAWIWLGDCG